MLDPGAVSPLQQVILYNICPAVIRLIFYHHQPQTLCPPLPRLLHRQQPLRTLSQILLQASNPPVSSPFNCISLLQTVSCSAPTPARTNSVSATPAPITQPSSKLTPLQPLQTNGIDYHVQLQPLGRLNPHL